MLDKLADYAVRYYNDFVKPTKHYRAPSEAEIAALKSLQEMIRSFDEQTNKDDMQTGVFTVGKEHGYENLREWFKALYEMLLGQSEGPRMGGFIKLYGREEMIRLIDQAIAGDLS